MKYISTRDDGIEGQHGTGVGPKEYTFEDALCSGYAPDGGLFVPSSLPTISPQDLMDWSVLTFPELAYRVLRMFISPSEVSDSDLRGIIEKSYPKDQFDDENFIPVKKLGSAFIAELFHGPTFCFKDLGMRPVIFLLSHFATLRRQNTTLLVSTTGDTGPAAVNAVGDASNPYLTILVHYPLGQISEFQRKQMTTVDSKCVKVAAFEGGGDDMDRPIKETLLNCSGGNSVGSGGAKRSFCGVNSYNIGRPLMQMIHFIWTYLRVAEKLGFTPGDENHKVDMVIPTGAMGNMTGGYIAKQMGVPIGKLCAGVNINDITHRAIQKGEFHKKRIQKTLSEAINIEVPYNFERILYYLTRGDRSLVRRWMATMDETQALTLESKWLARLQDDFRSASVSDDEMCQTLRQTFKALDYVADPHTTIAIAAAKQLGYYFEKADKTESIAIMATASPCKFEETVTVALGNEDWEKWKSSNFPSRALETLTRPENEPFLYNFDDGIPMDQVQKKWRLKMVQIVEENF